MRARIGSRIISIVFASMTLLLSLSLVITSARSAEEPSLLYATDLPFFATGSGFSQLAAFNLATVRPLGVIGNIGYPFSATLAFCPPGRVGGVAVAYTVTQIFGPSAQLATLNLATGAAMPVGSPLGQPNDIMGMACSRDGTLYAVGQSDPTQPHYNSLYIIDRVTGLASRIGSLGVSDGTGDDFLMALSFTRDGKLYGANVFALFRIDPETVHATKVVDFVGVNSVMGLAIDSDGNFYVADFVPGSRIYKVNTTTGVANPILNTDLDFVHNIAFKAPGYRGFGETGDAQ